MVEDDDLKGWLAEINMARALRVAARHPDCDALLDRLEGVESPPWPRLRAALVEVRGAARLEARNGAGA